MAEFNFKKMAEKVMRETINRLIIHGVPGFTWLKIISYLPPNIKLINAEELKDEIEANGALLVEEKETFCRMIDDAPVVISTESKESEV